MPKNQRDTFKRYCDQMHVHIGWINKHLNTLLKPYSKRQELHAYHIMNNMQMELIQLHDEIRRLKVLL